MAAPSRYDVSASEAGIEDGVLKNKLGIKDQEDLEDLETLLLNDAQTHFFEMLSQGKVVFNLALVFSIHKYFLETLYAWAGKLRTVDISKDGMTFASAKFLPSSVEVFGKILKANLPKATDSKKIIAEKIAIIHNEFNAVHPFREGNGRTIRLFLDLLVASLGLHAVDWAVKSYMRACLKGMSQDNAPMATIVYRGITKKL